MNKKQTGSYYTPSYLAEFMSKRVLQHFGGRNKLSLLEPSVGDGSFLKGINQLSNNNIYRGIALDINQEELNKAEEICDLESLEFINQDFLDFKSKKQYSIILGNPPYIKGNRLSQEQLAKCSEIHANAALAKRSIKNIWTSFIVKSTELLQKTGVLAFVLPAELLQVKYTEEIRTFLRANFKRLEIFTFEDLMFECKGQDTVVLFAYKKAKNKGLFYANIKDKQQLLTNDFSLNQHNTLIDVDMKWSHHILTSEEITFLFNLKNDLKLVSHYCDSMPGIVTAANKYFIVDEKTVADYHLEKYTERIVQKGLFVNGSVVFDSDEYDKIVKADLPSKLIRFQNSDKGSFSETVESYLNIGIQQEIHNRYKCRIRENWFVIPNVATQSEGFFFKRSHHYPKLLKNDANVFVTDSAYKIEMNEGFNIESLIFSFYNSLTLCFAELEGRYYGGGVLELTPSEFKKLPLPYMNVSKLKFDKFRTKFENKDSIDDVMKYYSKKILGINNEDFQKLERIRKKLIKKRMRK
jgi:adenine-specific DNA-methyltransferase